MQIGDGHLQQSLMHNARSDALANPACGKQQVEQALKVPLALKVPPVQRDLRGHLVQLVLQVQLVHKGRLG